MMTEYEVRQAQDSLRAGPQPVPTPQTLTVKELSKLTGVSETAIREGIAEERIPVIRYGGSIRIPRSVLTDGWSR
jgi:excisionase family DNA binding protein